MANPVTAKFRLIDMSVAGAGMGPGAMPSPAGGAANVAEQRNVQFQGTGGDVDGTFNLLVSPETAAGLEVGSYYTLTIESA